MLTVGSLLRMLFEEEERPVGGQARMAVLDFLKQQSSGQASSGVGSSGDPASHVFLRLLPRQSLEGL